jgi:hypothetical protein
MDNTKNFLKAGRTGIALGALLLTALTGCMAYVDAPHAEIDAQSYAFATQDDYVYYPSYGVYYSSSRRQYAYLDGNAWVARPAPRGVSVNVLLASPSVRMDYHDSPANHHAATVQQYPKNWSPPHPQQAQKDDKHDEHGQNNGR